MIEIVITLFIVGLIAGIVFSMPVTGPVSILIVSKALQGKLRYCTRTAIGATIVEFFYVFIVVYGIAALYSYYQPVIPYLILIGALFVILVSIKIIRHKFEFSALESQAIITDKTKNRGGMRTGIILNLTNPSLFINWLIASFIMLSFVSSLGFNTGGLDIILNENIKSVSEIAGTEFQDMESFNHNHEDAPIQNEPYSLPVIALSLLFAFSVSLGSLFWLDQLARIVIKFRDKIKEHLLNKVIHILGFVLICFGCYLAYRAVLIFIQN